MFGAFKCISPVTPNLGFQLSGTSTAWLSFNKKTAAEVGESVTAEAIQDKKIRITGRRVIIQMRVVSNSRI